MRELQLKSDQKKRHRWKAETPMVSACEDCGIRKTKRSDGSQHWTEWETGSGHYLGNSFEGGTPACEPQP